MFKKGPKVLYELTPVEKAKLMAYSTIIQGINGAMMEELKTMVIRERIGERNPVFDPQRMHFVQGEAPKPTNENAKVVEA